MNTKKRFKKIRSMYVAVFMAVTSLMIQSCATVSSDWNTAKEYNTKQSYQEFLGKHPHSQQAFEAKAAIENILWQNAEREDSAAAYKLYMQEYTLGLHKITARKRLENVAWKDAEIEDSRAAYKRFLKKFPQGLHATEAKTKLDKLNWKIAEKENSISAYRLYIKKNKTGIFITEAGRRLNGLLGNIIISYSDFRMVINALKELIAPFSIKDLYEECTKAPPGTDLPIRVDFSSSIKEISQILNLDGAVIVSKARPQTNSNPLKTTLINAFGGDRVEVFHVLGKVTSSDLYDGDYDSNPRMIVRLIGPKLIGPTLTSNNNIGFDEVEICTSDGSIETKYHMIGKNWYKID